MGKKNPQAMECSKLPVIMILDDDSDDVELLSEALRDAGYTGLIQSFTRDLEFLAFFRRCIDEHVPNVLVLDWNMPGSSGLDVLKTIQTEFPNNFSEILVFSTAMRPQDEWLARATGASGYYVKPAHFKEMVSFAQQLMGHLELAKQKWSQAS